MRLLIEGLGIAVVLIAVAMLATPLVRMVYAKPPTFVNGEQSIIGYTPIADVPKGKSSNVLSPAILEVAWTGDIAGVASYEGILMIYNLPKFVSNIHEKLYFPSVTVNGKSDSLTLVRETSPR